jgi:heme exporter protein A
VTANSVSLVLEAHNLSCLRDELPLFEPVSFNLAPGELLLIEGENGVGKTTLLRSLLGLTMLQAQSLKFERAPWPDCLSQLRRKARWLGHAAALKPELTVAENWRFWAALQSVRLHHDAMLIMGERLMLAGFEDARVGTLSAGQKKRAQLAQLLFGSASLWLLDEPFANFDRPGIALIESLMRDFLDAGGAMIATSHGVLEFAGKHKTLVLARAAL